MQSRLGLGWLLSSTAVAFALAGACRERSAPEDRNETGREGGATRRSGEFAHRLEYREALRAELAGLADDISEIERRAGRTPGERERAALVKISVLRQKQEALARELERLPYIDQSEWAAYRGGVEAGILDLRISLLDAYDDLEPGT